MTRTTAKHFAIFKKEAARCIKLWRIVGWRVEFVHAKRDARADVRASTKDHACVICLSTEWDEMDGLRVTDAMVRDSARHEVAHLLVDPLNEVAHFRYITQDQQTQAVESVVRHLEDILP